MDKNTTQPQNNHQDGQSSRPDGPRQAAGSQPPVTDNASNEKVMAILAYLGILCLIPVLIADESDFVKYHANQGLVLFIAEIILFAIGIIPIIGWLISFIGFLGAVILAIMGIINAANEKKEPLPLIGGYQILE